MTYDEAVGKVFRNEVNAYWASCLEGVLEKLLGVGQRLIDTISEADRKLFLKALENKSAVIVRGILETLNPETTKNIQGMDERMIWRIFWDLRGNRENAEISIFMVIGELNRNRNPL